MTDDQARRVSRRDALKGIAAAGAVAWATPVVQTVSMGTASATGGHHAPPGSPRTVCHRIKVKRNWGYHSARLSCDESVRYNDCLSPDSPDLMGTSGGCRSFVHASRLHGKKWWVLARSNCTITQSRAKAGGTCFDTGGDDTHWIVVDLSGRSRSDLEQVELEVCCEESGRR